MNSCSYFKLIGCFILISIATAQENQATCHFPSDCKEVYDQGNTCSGIYTIKPDKLPAFEVYCDMETDGGGWTVFQRRMDGTVNFYLNWADYEKGFGDLNGEFWLGLNKINRLTAGQSTGLRVDLEDFDGNGAYATYSTFNVGNANIKYTLTVSGYGGDAGDSLTYHNGMNFTTQFQDNDDWDRGNCAKLYSAAWWYNNCHRSSLNGLYLVGTHSSYSDGVIWYDFKGHYYSLKTTEMKLKSN